MQPKQTLIGEYSHSVPTDLTDLDEFVKSIGIPTGKTEYGRYVKCPMWNGHRFEAVECTVVGVGTLYLGRQGGGPVAHERSMILFHPIDPRIILSDFENATRSSPNETNTAWLFLNGGSDDMREIEGQVRNSVFGVFERYMDALTNSYRIAPATPDTSAPIGERKRPKSAWLLDWQHLKDFRNMVLAEAIKQMRTHPIGARPKIEPLVLEAIKTVQAKEQHTGVDAYINQAKGALAPFAYELPWVQRARLKAEADARKAAEAEEGDNSGDGG